MQSYSLEEFLQVDTWYHATIRQGYESIMTKKIQASFNKMFELDFGYGFYLTPSLDWVQKYAKSFDGEERIFKFNFRLADILNENVSFRFWDSLNDDFAEFVFQNRMYFSDYANFKIHDYDIVGGVMSDGNQPTDFEEFRNDLISKAELFRRICLPKEDWQIAISSQEICDMLKPVDVFDLKGVHYDVSNY